MSQVEQLQEIVDDSVVAITTHDFILRLRERVSQYDAKLIFESAITSSNLKLEDNSEQLRKSDATALCLELIKRGGPAFQVGTNIYREVCR